MPHPFRPVLAKGWEARRVFDRAEAALKEYRASALRRQSLLIPCVEGFAERLPIRGYLTTMPFRIAARWVAQIDIAALSARLNRLMKKATEQEKSAIEAKQGLKPRLI